MSITEFDSKDLLDNYKMLQDYFETNKTNALPNIVSKAIDVISSDETVDDDMALFFALEQCSLLASMLNKKINYNKVTKVTTNLFGILLNKSGSGKDKATSTIRNSFQESYDLILRTINIRMVTMAKAEAQKVFGNDNKWKDFYKGEVTSLFPSVSTTEGMLSQMEKLEYVKLGAFNMSSSEFLTELKSPNSILVDNLKTLAIGYDLGYVPEKIVKTDTLKIRPIENLNINMTVFSSAETLFKNKVVASKFVETLSVQFSRRSLVIFVNSTKIEKPAKSLVDMVRLSNESENVSEKALEDLRLMSNAIVNAGLKSSSELKLAISTDVTTEADFNARAVITLYKKYCKFRANAVKKNGLLSLHIEHAYWRVLKLSGLFAVLKADTEIKKEYVFMAIGVVEKLLPHMDRLTEELSKEVYEQIISYIKEIPKKIGFITKHNLVKEKLVDPKISKKMLTEFIELANSSTDDMVLKYNSEKDRVSFKKAEITVIQKIDRHVATMEVEKEKINAQTDSTKMVASLKEYKDKNGNWLVWDNPKDSKDFINRASKDGFRGVQTDFFKFFKHVLGNPTSYSNYIYKDGVRLLDNVQNKANTLIIDVDKTNVSMTDMSALLKPYRHVIATTSDRTNMYKYRIALQLDTHIDVDARQWKLFYKAVCNTLGVEADTAISKVTSFIGYKDSIIISNDGALFKTANIMLKVLEQKEKEDSKKKPIPKLTDKQLDYLWDERFEDFGYAYEISSERIPKLYNVMRSAIDKGYNATMTKELIFEINEALVRPIKHSDLKRQITDQISKFV